MQELTGVGGGACNGIEPGELPGYIYPPLLRPIRASTNVLNCSSSITHRGCIILSKSSVGRMGDERSRTVYKHVTS